MMALKRPQLDSVYRKISLLFAGWQPQPSQQKPLDPQQFLTSQLLYKAFLFAKKLRTIRKQYKELTNNEQLIKKADRYIAQINKTQCDEKIKRIGIISLENARAQVQMGAVYIKKIQQQQGKILNWVQNFYDLPANLQMKHLEKAKPLKSAFGQSLFTDQILKGYYEDYLQSKQLIDQIYQKFMYDVQMIKVFIDESKSIESNIIEAIKHLGETQ